MEKLQRIGRRGGNLVQDAFRLCRIALVKQRLRERNLVVDRLQIGHGAERTRRARLVLLLWQKQRLRERNLVVERLQTGHGAEGPRRARLVLLLWLRPELSGERWIELLRRALRA